MMTSRIERLQPVVKRTSAAVTAAIAGVALAVTSVLLSTITAQPAAAADLANFNPGFIVSDAVFYDSTSMTAAQIQTFLQDKGASCTSGADGSPCLKKFTMSTPSRAATANCTQAYVGAADETASTIVAKVGLACGISPRVLLVMLQKEQGLVTTTNPSASRYQKAMGYGCPDTSACDTTYYGFFNQVYSAASQLRNYANNPSRFSYRYGMTNNILYNPNRACGSSGVFIKNQATASLYNYTPYQPNAAALNAGYGTGDSCSAYGNRNFWNYFSDWFGSPTGSSPVGRLDSSSVNADGVSFTGWAYDPDTTAAIQIRVDLDVRGSGQKYTANVSRPDVGAALGVGDNHGYQVTVGGSPGPHSVCLWALNTDATSPDTLVYCADIVIPKPTIGYVDSITSTVTETTVSGWAVDLGTDTPVTVVMSVDGVESTTTANTSRPDVGTFFGIGPNHGYTITMPASLGTHNVCLKVIGIQSGTSPTIACRTITVVNTPASAWLDSLTTTATSITASGWAYDHDTTDPINVQMTVDGVTTTTLANTSRPDVGTFFGIGPNHGYTTTTATTTGTHNVCLTAINTPAGPNTTIACRTITVVNTPASAWLDSLTTTATSITASGWAYDHDTTDPINVQMTVDGVTTTTLANTSRPDVGTFFGIGPNHGYTTTTATTTGTHNVCLTAINTPAGPNTTIACRTITVG